MIMLYAVRKLLNTSRIKTGLYITRPSENQQLHRWYATLVSAGYPGKFVVLYVHQPSLMAIVCKGRTIQTTWTEFTQRLPNLLTRHHFSETFIAHEMAQAKEYVVGHTDSRSMLANINSLVPNVTHNCSIAGDYTAIDQDRIEDFFMTFPHGGSYSPNAQFSDPKTWWKQYFQALK